MLIENSEQLGKLLIALDNASVIGIDTEFIRQTTYHPELALIQIAVDDSAYIIDPLKLPDLSEMIERMRKLTCIFHDGAQDLEIFKHIFHFDIERFFDTQIAALFLGYKLAPPYNALVYDYCRVNVSKNLQIANWMKRPLPERMLKYAANDVLYLEKIADMQLLALHEKGYLEYVKDELDCVRASLDFANIIDRLFSKLCFRITSYEEAAMLYQLVFKREMVAKQTNVRRSLVADDIEIVGAVKDYHSSELFEKLGDIDDVALPDDLSTKYESLRAFSKIDWNAKKPQIIELQARIAEISLETGISIEMIGAVRDIKIAIFDPERSIFKTTWRKNFTVL